MNLGAGELAIVLVIVLVLFGGAKLPKLARSLGQAQKEFRDGLRDGISADDEPAPPPAPKELPASPVVESTEVKDRATPDQS